MSEAKAAPSLTASVLRGAVGFAAVGAASFAVWAFGGRHLGTAGVYGGTAAAFLVLSVLFLHPLAGGPARFARAFIPAFLAYCAVWCLFWFRMGFGLGEWLGSAVGCLAFAFTAGSLLGRFDAAARAFVVLFIAHSAGYFLGGLPYYAWRKSMPSAMMLAWGLIYGLGFGAGIGFVFWSSRQTEDVRRQTG
jgi:hypothetical protein